MNLYRTFIPAVVFATLSVIVAASKPVYADACDDAGKYMQHVGDQALSVITNKKSSKEAKRSQLEKIFAGNVDIPWVGRFVMGQYWRQATEDQKSRYLRKYEKFLILHYTSRFADYSSGTFTITGTKPDENDNCTVSMELKGDKPGDEPVLVDYRVKKNSGFKIFDVIVEGVSLITTQRAEFSSVIGSHDINYLINKLDNMSITDPEKKN